VRTGTFSFIYNALRGVGRFLNVRFCALPVFCRLLQKDAQKATISLSQVYLAGRPRALCRALAAFPRQPVHLTGSGPGAPLRQLSGRDSFEEWPALLSGPCILGVSAPESSGGVKDTSRASRRDTARSPVCGKGHSGEGCPGGPPRPVGQRRDPQVGDRARQDGGADGMAGQPPSRPDRHRHTNPAPSLPSLNLVQPPVLATRNFWKVSNPRTAGWAAEKASPPAQNKSILFPGQTRPHRPYLEGGIDSPPDNRSPPF
jgi:hypothetical protein